MRIMEFERLIGGVLKARHIYPHSVDYEDYRQICRLRIFEELKKDPQLASENNSYLFRILCNVICDYGRKQQRIDRLNVKLQSFWNPSEQINTMGIDRELMITLWQLWKELPLGHQKNILHDWLIYPDAKITERCQRLKISASTFTRHQRDLFQWLQWTQK
ncbi:sigma-70 family RNA polymerase sigma factor [Weissella kandleri]|nr:sigma-70 family RNA polymerase sigma factor [Weissella kandleri]